MNKPDIVIFYFLLCFIFRHVQLHLHRYRDFSYMIDVLTECPCTMVICSLMNIFLSRGNVVNMVGRMHWL